MLGRVGDDLPGRTVRGVLVDGGSTQRSRSTRAPTGTMLVVHEPGNGPWSRTEARTPGSRPRTFPAIEAGAVLISGYLLLQEAGHDAAVEAGWRHEPT